MAPLFESFARSAVSPELRIYPKAHGLLPALRRLATRLLAPSVAVAVRAGLIAAAIAVALMTSLAGVAHAAGAVAEPQPWRSQAQLTPMAEQALQILRAAAQHGLNPEDYQLSPFLTAPPSAGVAPEISDAALEPALTAVFERFLRDLHDGRVDPRSIHQRFRVTPRPPLDAAGVLRAARLMGDLDAAVRAATPPLQQYKQLQQALAQYQRLVGHAAWETPLPALPRVGRSAKLEPGQSWGGVPMLAARLQALGDMDPAQAQSLQPALVYSPALVDAVSSFQERHGLVADGVVGLATHAALQAMPAQRASQIALSMERLRWTPLMQGRRMLVINIPEFVLRGYEVVDGQIAVRTAMKVIVGRALDTRTPLFDELMRAIEFSPYWNVPPSIARAETVPRLRRDPAYFERQGFEFVGADGRADTTLTPQKLDAVLAGQLRIRQRPGPLNALGDIKFVFPNRENIFLHHTPAPALFTRDRRDFSHGCIRVEEPVALASFVLAEQPEWDEARIRAAMTLGSSNSLRLREPLPVVIAYATALVKSGRTWFFDDIYGHDRLLAQALQARSAALQSAGR